MNDALESIILPEATANVQRAAEPISSFTTPATLPIDLQFRLRRIVSGFFFSQIFLHVIVVVALRMSHPPLIQHLFHDKTYLWLFVLVIALCLLLLYNKRFAYPKNLAILSIYTTSLAIILAALDLNFDVSVVLYTSVSFCLSISFHGVILLFPSKFFNACAKDKDCNTLLSYRKVAYITVFLCLAISAIVNFMGNYLPWITFAAVHGFMCVFIFWISYVQSRVSQRCLSRLRHGHSIQIIVIYFTDVALFVFFFVSLLFSCIAFEGCACCGASDDVPGAVDVTFPLGPHGDQVAPITSPPQTTPQPIVPPLEIDRS